MIILLGTVVSLAFIVWLFCRQAGVRRGEYERMRRERDMALKAMQEVEIEADSYRDIDAVLAARVREITRRLNSNRMELDR
jgi:predicted  nucleic acid-binding Zn-ribbon protein